MKKILIIYLVIFQSHLYGFDMPITDVRFRNMADSILKNIDISFEKKAVYLYTMERDWHECLLKEEIINSLSIASISYEQSKHYALVYYSFIDACGQKYGYMTGTLSPDSYIYMTGTLSPDFYIVFDMEYNKVCFSQYWLVKEVFSASDNCYISLKEAQKIAVKNSNHKSKKTDFNYLLYDTAQKIVIWLIRRETKKCKFYNLETLKIDALTGKIIEKKEFVLWKPAKHKRRKYPDSRMG